MFYFIQKLFMNFIGWIINLFKPTGLNIEHPENDTYSLSTEERQKIATLRIQHLEKTKKKSAPKKHIYTNDSYTDKKYQQIMRDWLS
jgi:hypothetical protein